MRRRNAEGGGLGCGGGRCIREIRPGWVQPDAWMWMLFFFFFALWASTGRTCKGKGCQKGSHITTHQAHTHTHIHTHSTRLNPPPPPLHADDAGWKKRAARLIHGRLWAACVITQARQEKLKRETGCQAWVGPHPSGCTSDVQLHQTWHGYICIWRRRMSGACAC